MINKYEELNDDALEFFILLLDKKTKNAEKIKRCREEINILHDKSILFIIEYLYLFKEDNKNSRFHFKGMANNLLLLYLIGLSNVNPLEYDLPYELFNENTLNIDFINCSYLDFINYLELFSSDFRIIKGYFKRSNDDEKNIYMNNHYLLIPSYYQPKDMTLRINELNQLETIEEYYLFKDRYLIIRLDDKIPIFEKKVDIKNVLISNLEKDLANLFQLNTINDYSKIISLAHSVHLWKENQEILYKEGKITIKNLISSREDIYNYLISHNIDNDISVDIIKLICKSRNNESSCLWKRYVDIMKNHNCDDLFIDVISRVLYIHGKGQAISECIYALDSDNYYIE